MKRFGIIKFLMKPGIAIFALCFVASVAGVSQAADEDPFARLADTAVSFFTPMEGSVVSVSGDTVTSDIGTEAGIQKGMRLDITRKGAPFVHPITKEKLGLMESPVGRAEVIEASENASTLKVLSGEPMSGDILRISSAFVRLLFFQSGDMDWNVSEKYYETLSQKGRFSLIDTAPGVPNDDIATDEARRSGAEAAIVLTTAKSDGGLTLRQRLIWASDSKEFSTDSSTVGPELLAELRLGSELFTPKKDYVISYDVPYSTSVLGAGDIDGDGTQELIMGTGSTLSFHNTEGPLDKILGGLEYKGPRNEEIIWLDAYDLNGDGRDELAITSKSNSRIVSRVYQYKDGSFTKALEGNHFLRVVDGRLYGQKFDKSRGYSGPVFLVAWGAPKDSSEKQVLDLPPGVNIYDFSFIDSSEGNTLTAAFDEAGYLNLYDEKGMRIWRSANDYGKGNASFKLEGGGNVGAGIRPSDSSTTVYSLKEWSVRDRIHVMGGSALVTRRIPLSGKAPGLGIKNSQVVGLRRIGPSFQETPMFKEVSGNIKDFAIVGDRIYILTRPPMGFDAKKLLKGKNPLINRLFVYSLKGI